MKTSSRFTIIAAAGILVGGMSSAQAGGLGGDCCADLEERVAELEATTVRKGNRKVSLRLSGQVSRSVLWWDDGFEDNVYSVDNQNASTRFRLTGKAGILPGLTAGYKIELETETARSASVDQIDDDRPTGGDGAVEVRIAEWWLKHDTLGKLTIGQGDPATKNLLRINLGGTAVATKDGRIDSTGGGFFLRQTGVSGVNGLIQGTRLNEVTTGLESNRRDRVRYDSPTIAGFTLSAAWGEDDYWDVALRFAQEMNGIRIAGGVGYVEDHDEEPDLTGFGADRDRSEYKASISAWAPGLFGVGPYMQAAYMRRIYDGTSTADSTVGIIAGTPQNRPDFDFWRVEGGVRHNFTGLGDTSIYGEYANAEDGITGRAEAGFAEVSSSEVDVWGLGVVQRINAAAMEVFLSYRQYEVSTSGVNAGGNAIAVPLEDYQFVHAGGRIKF